MVAAIKTISLNPAFSSLAFFPSLSLSLSLFGFELFPRCHWSKECFSRSYNSRALRQPGAATTRGVNDLFARGFPETLRHVGGSSIRLLDAFVAIHALKLQFGSWIALMRAPVTFRCHILAAFRASCASRSATTEMSARRIIPWQKRMRAKFCP